MSEDKNAPSSHGAKINIKLGKNVFKGHVSEIHQEELDRIVVATPKRKALPLSRKVLQIIRSLLEKIIR